jgi:hypothetical protein
MDRQPGDEPSRYDDQRGHYHQSQHHLDIDYERQRTAATRDYTTPAVITLILYFVCWLPGVIANIIYFLQARQDEALVGREPQGKGCLLWLLIVMNGLIVVSVGLYCMLFFVFGIAAGDL